MSNWQVIEGDCLDVMAEMEAGSVDAVVTDPPYDQQTHDGCRVNPWSKKGREIKGSPLTFRHINGWSVVPACLVVSRRWVLVFCSIEDLGEYRRVAGGSWVRSGVWLRTDSAPQFTGDRPAQAVEGVAIMHPPGKKRWNGGGHRGAWVGGVAKGTDRCHPAQKPLWLMRELVQLFTDPDDLVLDPFCGSGTTGVACVELGRHFIGIEIDHGYCEIARERIGNATRQQQLNFTVPKPEQQELL